jgi:mycothiol synthase
VIERPCRPEDLDAVIDLFCRYEQRFRGAPDTEAADITEDWATPGWDFAVNTRVLEQDGRVVGYALTVQEHADTVVDVDLDDDEPWRRLLGWVETAGRPLEHYAPDGDPRLNRLLGERGWVDARRFWRMRIELHEPVPEPVWPQGVEVRDYRRGEDDHAVHELISTSFREIGGQQERSFENWSQWLLETARFDPSLYLVAVADGRVVGASLGQEAGGEGFVRQLAVHPSQRGRGLALALLREGFRRNVARGMGAAILGVDAANPTGALALYEKAGMRVHEQFTRWDWTRA